jgi:hypothetical protein
MNESKLLIIIDKLKILELKIDSLEKMIKEIRNKEIRKDEDCLEGEIIFIKNIEKHRKT